MKYSPYMFVVTGNYTAVLFILTGMHMKHIVDKRERYFEKLNDEKSKVHLRAKM